MDSGLNAIKEPFLKDSNGDLVLHQDVRPHFDLSNDSVRRWWVDHAVDMSNKDEIDGIFYDAIAKVVTSYIESSIGSGKKEAVRDAFHTMMEECQVEMDPAKINIANLIRASFENYGMDNLHYYDGSYLEGFKGSPSYYAQGIEAAQTAARDGYIICLTLGMDEILPSIDELVEEGGYLVLPDSVQKEFDFYLSIFLTIAEEYSYLLVHDAYGAYSIMGNDRLWLKRFTEYDRPLGPPKGPAVRNGYIYTRQFEHAAVYLDLSTSEGRINWGSDSIPYPPGEDPEQEKPSLRFVVSEANSPAYVSGALIELDTLSGLTNDAGQLVFSLDSGYYDYTIAINGFFPVDSSIHLVSDTTISISMYSSTADVKFRIRNGDAPLGAAVVSVGGNAMQSNLVGMTVFEDLPVRENYGWSVEKEGFGTASGSFYLVRDTTINVQMELSSGVHIKEDEVLHLYPVPADSYFVIETSRQMESIQLTDLSGRLVFSEKVRGTYLRRELPQGMARVNILKVHFADGSVITRKLITYL